MNTYKNMPENRKQAILRAKRLQKYLNESTGVKWKIRVHCNLGWFYNCLYGTLSVSEYAQSYGNGGYTIMNSAYTPGSGNGHMEMLVYQFKKRENLKPTIMLSLIDQRNLALRFMSGYNLHSKITGFKPLTGTELQYQSK